MNVVVLYESLTGNTRKAAELIGGAARAVGADASVRRITASPLADLDIEELARADVVFVGTWTDGFIVAGMRPGRAGRLWGLPVLDHKKVGVFCTYAVNPGKTLAKLARIMEAKGATVVARRGFRRDRLSTENPGFVEFVDEALAAVPA